MPIYDIGRTILYDSKLVEIYGLLLLKNQEPRYYLKEYGTPEGQILAIVTESQLINPPLPSPSPKKPIKKRKRVNIVKIH